MPRIVSANPESIAQAADILLRGGVVGFPTETVYGLGALTFDERAIERVYELKGRPADNPLIAHVLHADQARDVIAPGTWDARCEALAARFWPGPLTLVLPKSKRVGDRATAGRPTIAVRSPRHPASRALLEAVCEAGPICAPSANRSGRVSPTSAQHVQTEFEDVPQARDLLILDGGQCDVGIESTVLDMTVSPPRVLRHGSVTLETLGETLGDVEAPESRTQIHSPGTSESHYAPRTPTEVVSTQAVKATLQRFSDDGVRCAAMVFDEATVGYSHVALVMPREAERYAHDLYRRLREADAIDCQRIIVEAPPDGSHAWRAVHDRLQRASARR